MLISPAWHSLSKATYQGSQQTCLQQGPAECTPLCQCQQLGANGTMTLKHREISGKMERKQNTSPSAQPHHRALPLCWASWQNCSTLLKHSHSLLGTQAMVVMNPVLRRYVAVKDRDISSSPVSLCSLMLMKGNLFFFAHSEREQMVSQFCCGI